MRIVIVGPGALGYLLTARLVLLRETERGLGADNDLPYVCLLDYRPERAEQLRQSGLLFEEQGRQVRCAIRVETDPGVCRESDVLFLCVKATAVTKALDGVSPFLSFATMVVAMQNGISHVDQVAALSCPSAVGITSEGATLIAPGHVCHGGGGTTRIGLLDNASPVEEELLAKTVALLNSAGFHTVATSDPLKHLWAKLFVNVAINALTAIHRCPNGELLHSPETRNMMKEAVEEAVSVARALGIEVEGDPVASAYSVCQSTAANISSMHQDVKNKRLTEIDAINGAVAAHGMRLGIPTPVNDELVRQIRRIEASYIP